ncbi:MAG TPA: lactate racemase domain-containing protein [Bacteroidota bacterium]|nr:lactate racemase domain-containing protein [Bacteroidota bacterium]
MMVGRDNIPHQNAEDEIYRLSEQALVELPLDGKRVLVIIPDTTRHAHLPIFFKTLGEILSPKVKALDYLIATGTHHPLEDEIILRHVGITAEEHSSKYAKTRFFNHAHNDPAQLRTIGMISASDMTELSTGLFTDAVDITINKRIFDYDQLIVVSPVVPHETVGFAGGNKYFFPGIGGEKIIETFHWIGALITNPAVNGIKDTPVRRVINKAASLISVPRICFAYVVDDHSVTALFIGSPEEAWGRAADVSSRIHIKYVDHGYPQILGLAPEIYDDIWVAGKVMYKHEPIVADGGEVIIYAPHIKEISYTHGKEIRKVGYHTRDYFTKQWDRFSGMSKLILAHSTNVKGIGTFENGIERPRVQVTLATSISKEVCEAVNLGYVDYRSINVAEWKANQNGDLLVVENAGQHLYRLREDKKLNAA